MSTSNKNQGQNEPLHIHLGNDEDEHDDIEVFDDGEVAVIRPKARNPAGQTSRRRGLHDQAEDKIDEEELPPSKTKIKKHMHELRDLGKELTELGKDQLNQIDIPENLREAINEMRSIKKFGAQRRQIQYIGKLMREVDPEPILEKLDIWKGKSRHHTAHMHQLERWRDRLIASDNAITDLLTAHPHADAQHLRSLIRNARKEIDTNKPPKNFREIFQLLKEIFPEP